MVSTTPRALGVPMSVAICLIILFVSVLRGSAAEESSLQESNFTGVGLGLSVFAYVDTMDAPDQSSAPLASPALAPEGSPTPSPQSAPPTPSPAFTAGDETPGPSALNQSGDASNVVPSLALLFTIVAATLLLR